MNGAIIDTPEWLTELHELAAELASRYLGAESQTPRPLTLVDLREQLHVLETEWLPTIGRPAHVRPTLTLIQGGA